AGHRIMNEDVSYAVSPGILRDHGGIVWTIFDEHGRQSLDSGYAHWTPEVVESEAQTGRMPRAPSLERLARQISVPETNLTKTVDNWNAQLPNGCDPDFMRYQTLRKQGFQDILNPISEPPFYAARTRPAELVCTHTGLAIDRRAQVRNRHGDVIAGLYAAGEAGAGVLGERYVGGGNSVANALTMGRLAGLSAAAAL